MKPTAITVKASVISVVDSIIEDRELKLVNFTSITDGEVKSVWIPKATFEGFGANTILVPGNVVYMVIANCYANITTYLDEDGNEQVHEKDHVEFVNCLEVPITNLIMDIMQECMIKGMRADLAREFAHEYANNVTSVRSSTIKTITKSVKSVDVASLIEKYNTANNPIYKSAIAAQLEKLGGVFDKETNSWRKDTDPTE